MRAVFYILVVGLLLSGLSRPLWLSLHLAPPSPFLSVALAEQQAVAQETAGGEDKDAKVLKEETELEAQVRVVASKLRCPVCQGESVYDSHADVAEEMKRLIAEKLSAGESESAILNYFQIRYGNFILMEPPVEGLHWVIWVFPLFLALVGFLLVSQYISSTRQQAAEVAANILSEEEDGAGSDGARGDDVPDVRELRL